MTPRRAAALLAPVLLAACGDSKAPPRTPPPAASSSGIIITLGDRSSVAFREATVLLSGRPLTGPSSAAARSWTHSADCRRWTFEVDSAAAWVNAWPGPGKASAPAPASLVIDLESPDPELPARLVAVAPLRDGPFGPAQSLGADWRLLSPRSEARPTLRIGSSVDAREAIESFRAGRISRLDFIPPDRATALRTDPSFRTRESASTLVLVIDLEEAPARAAVAATIDAEMLCRKALFDAERVAHRIAPPAMGLGEPTPPRLAHPGRIPASITLAAEGAEPAMLLPAVRAALRLAGTQPAEPEPGHPARLRLLTVAPATAALDDLFRPLRFLAADHPDIAPLFDSLDASLDPAERAAWAGALEAALLDARLVVPIASGRTYSLVRPGTGIELDPWGRYAPVTEAGR